MIIRSLLDRIIYILCWKKRKKFQETINKPWASTALDPDKSIGVDYSHIEAWYGEIKRRLPPDPVAEWAKEKGFDIDKGDLIVVSTRIANQCPGFLKYPGVIESEYLPEGTDIMLVKKPPVPFGPVQVPKDDKWSFVKYGGNHV